MNKRLLFDRCLTGDRNSKAIRTQKVLYSRGLGGVLLLDRCLTGKAQTVETRIMGLSLLGAATVKESLAVRYDENRRIAEARQADAEEIAELARIEKQLERKKG
jgi:hypothetical protein